MVNTERLDACGWTSYDPTLFLNEPGRKGRENRVGPHILSIVQDYSPGNRVLELCSGGGGLLIFLARCGLEVTGIDLSEEMLRFCRTEIEAEPEDVQSRIKLVQRDIVGFELDCVFDFVILEDDGFQCLLTGEDQVGCLESVENHLGPDGRFLLAFSHQARKKEADEYDPLMQIRTSQEVWAKPDDEGNIEEVPQGFEKARLTYPCELDLLLKTAGLVAEEKWGDYLRSSLTDPEQQGYHYLIRGA